MAAEIEGLVREKLLPDLHAEVTDKAEAKEEA